jgi:two-component system nitrate/nitrite response regulator NarL
MSGADSLKALHQGVSGILLKHNALALLTKAIRQVEDGEMWVDQRVIQLIAEGVQQREAQGLRKSIAGSVRKRIMDREQMVLRGVADRLTNKSIANEIGVSEGAIKTTLRQLFDKKQVRTRSHLVRVAMERGESKPLENRWRRTPAHHKQMSGANNKE